MSKTRSTYYTPERVASFRKFQGKESAKTLQAAEGYLAYGYEHLWGMVISQNIPRGWEVVPTDRGWDPVPGQLFKVKKDGLTMPSNDFVAYYRSGLDDRGFFRPELADRSLLKNQLYPKKSDDWGVDDGFGWVDEQGQRHTFVAFYNHWHIWYEIRRILVSFRDAFLYTGDVRYAHAGIILLDRVADVYPDLDIAAFDGSIFGNSSGGTGQGKMVGAIWETNLIRAMVSCYDAFFPILVDAAPEVTDFLTKKAAQFPGLSEKKLSLAGIRQNIEEGLVKQVLPAFKKAQIRGNFGMHEAALAMSAVVMDEPFGYTKEAIDYIFKPGRLQRTGDKWETTGGNLLATLVDVIDRDGHGNEASPHYNGLHIGQTANIADILEGYDGYNGVNLSTYPKYVKMRNAQKPLIMLDRFMPAIGDTQKTGNPSAKYAGVDESVNLTGFGFTGLRDGVGDSRRACWLYYGRNRTGHAHSDALNLGLYGYGLDLSPDLGYPETTGRWPKRRNWTGTTISHNLVLVDKERQSPQWVGTPYHFEGDGYVQLMDVAAPKAYPQTSLYRRTTAMVRIDDENSYYIDFFRVKGGREHHFLFHGAEGEVQTGNIKLQPQPKGTYAGENVPFADPDYNKATGGIYNDGFNYLYDVATDSAPPAKFSVDWDVVDTWHVLPAPEDVHLKLTMLGPVDEVTLAHGDPPQINRPGNPRRLKYLIAHRSGEHLSTVFTSVLEPYKDSPAISAISAVSIEPLSEREESGEAKAVKVVLPDGRTDYVITSLDPEVTYRVDGKLLFRGFFGVYSETFGYPSFGYLVDGNLIGPENKAVVAQEERAITGKILDFTREMSLQNEIKVQLDQNVDPQALVGRTIYVQDDGERNAVYALKEIKEHRGNVATFDIGDTTLIRKFADPNDYDQGYVYDIAPGSPFRIPLASFVRIPEVEIGGLRTIAGKAITEDTTLNLHVALPQGRSISTIKVEVDENTFSEGEELPSEIRLNPQELQAGAHTLSVRVITKDGRIAQKTAQFTVK